MRNSGAAGDPPYRRIAAEISWRITSGQLRPGDRVPSARQITREWGVAIATATKVLATLRQEGLVRAVPGVGTVVATADAPAPAPADDGAGARSRTVRPAEAVLTQDLVVRTAIAIADAEGLQALSMRRIATELEVATMSLYRHVAGRDQLVVLMADAVFGEHGFPEQRPPGWRAQLELAARLLWATYRRHPWLARVVTIMRPMLAPNGMAHTEWSMRALDGLGLDLETMIQASVVIAGFAQGTAVNLEAELQAQQDTGVTSDEWMEGQGEIFANILASGRFPMLARLVEEPEVDFDLDLVFETGLALILDGLAALIARQPRPRS